MGIRKEPIGGYIATIDTETSSLLAFEPTAEYTAYKNKAIEEVLQRRQEFQDRGAMLVKPSLASNWNRHVSMYLDDTRNVWYCGVNIEATLQCMARLSEGLPVEEAYLPIDVQNPNEPCIHIGMELSGWQNAIITDLIRVFHERGEEFYEYRQKRVSAKTGRQIEKI